MLAASIDIGGTKTIIGIIDDKGNILTKAQMKTDTSNYEYLFSACVYHLNSCLEDMGVHPSDLLGLGVTLPGMVNPHSGFLHLAPFAGWHNVNAAQYFMHHTDIQDIYVENDVNACALGEMYLGHTSENFLWVTVSTGIGGAIVSNNHLIVGKNFCAGEIGHTKVEYNHPRPCSCGQYGCVEAHGSGTAITNMFKELIQRDTSYGGKLDHYGLKADAEGCAYLARIKDKECLEIFKTSATYLGRALSYAINLFNPEEIFIGGGVSRSFDLIHDEIIHQIKQHTIPQCGHVVVKPTALGYEAALLGAAALVFLKKV